MGVFGFHTAFALSGTAYLLYQLVIAKLLPKTRPDWHQATLLNFLLIWLVIPVVWSATVCRPCFFFFFSASNHGNFTGTTSMIHKVKKIQSQQHAGSTHWNKKRRPSRLAIEFTLFMLFTALEKDLRKTACDMIGRARKSSEGFCKTCHSILSLLHKLPGQASIINTKRWMFPQRTRILL